MVQHNINYALTSLCQSLIVLHVIKIKEILKLFNSNKHSRVLVYIPIGLCTILHGECLELIATRLTHPYEASVQWSWDNLKPAVVNALSSMFNKVM